MFRKTLVLFLVTGMVFPPVSTLAGPTVPGLRGTVPAAVPLPADTLPIPTDVNLRGVSAFAVEGAARKLTVQQDEPRAVINWKSFDIGEQAWTHFDQKGNKDWAALNRIHDLNPSRIMGRLTADGKIYLINQNGILFGKKSTVNVHSLTAATANIRDSDYLNDVLRFKTENYIEGTEKANFEAVLSNSGKISTDELGSVFLIGPTVENRGTIETKTGQIGLAAGKDVLIKGDEGGSRTALVVNVTDVEGVPGRVVNAEGAKILANTGLIGLYGREIEQNGTIEAVSAIKKSGEIELLAVDKVSTGPRSRTAATISESGERAHESFDFQRGEIRVRGMDPSSPLFPRIAVGEVDHRGVLEARSGRVEISADKQVLLNTGSVIDVSGNWVELPAEASVVELQLNSVEMRDEYAQKDGILKGATIKFEALFGSTIGDVSAALRSQERTAMERSTPGGEVDISASSGSILMNKGAVVDFSGGGFQYARGQVETTVLMAGKKSYDIGTAPDWLIYDRVSTVKKMAGGYSEGADAGLAQLAARYLVLGGRLDGTVSPGYYQTMNAEPSDALGRQAARGWKCPEGGTLILGESPLALKSAELQDFVVHAMRVVKGAPSASDLFYGSAALYDPAEPRTSLISSNLLNEAGLSNLQLYANTVVETAPGASINLRPGAAVSIGARRIDHFGSISTPGGSINLAVQDNRTSFVDLFGAPNHDYLSVAERIYLGAGSVLSVAGERVDLAFSPSIPHAGAAARLNGGRILIKDKTIPRTDENPEQGDGVIMVRGSVVDVAGGYEIGSATSLRGGDAGSLEVQGRTIVLDGELRGHSLAGKKGGKLGLHAENVLVKDSFPGLPAGFGPREQIPSALAGRLVLADDRLDGTGFTQLELRSENDVLFDPNVSWSPSRVKLAAPSASRASIPGLPGGLVLGSGVPGTPMAGGLLAVDADRLGTTSFRAAAGVLFEGALPTASANDSARVFMAGGAALRLSPGGEAIIDGPAVKVLGTIEALAGRVNLRARNGALVVGEGASVLAAGYNLRDNSETIRGAPLGFTPLDAGNVVLEALNGDIVLEKGSLIDVSGSSPVRAYVKRRDGTYEGLISAGAPGSFSLSFLGDLLIEGSLNARARMSGLPGGILSVTKRSTVAPLVLSQASFSRATGAGFDDMTFRSWRAIQFEGPLEQRIARGLTLDTPLLSGTGNGSVHLESPWIRLVNTYFPDSNAKLTVENGNLQLSGGWIDVEGGVRVSGFQEVLLSAQRDIRLADRYYLLGQNSLWRGLLDVAGDMTMEGDRVYTFTPSSKPSTGHLGAQPSDVTVQVGGKLTILPGDNTSGFIYSVGGRLGLKVGSLEHRGYLAAPFGQIDIEGLTENSRLYLAQNSVLSTAGVGSVPYGALADGSWTVLDKSRQIATLVETAPVKSVSLSGSEVIIRDGAVIDVSGGGSFFAYQFLAGIQGSLDPLRKKDTYVVLPGDPLALPGPAIYLQGSPGLKEGLYSLLPEQYAFLPGAMVIRDTGKAVAKGDPLMSAEGYTVVGGASAYAGTGFRNPSLRGYTVRSAAEVLREGYYEMAALTAGNAGRVSIRGDSTITDGVILAGAMTGFDGGNLTLTGRNIMVQAARGALPIHFDFDSLLPDEFVGKLRIAADTLSGRGMRALGLGDQLMTESIVLDKGVVLSGEKISLQAARSITLEEDAEIHAVSEHGGGSLEIETPSGRLSLAEGSLLHASDALNLNVGGAALAGRLQVDRGVFGVASDRILFTQESMAPSEQGFAISESLWTSSMASLDEVRLRGVAGIFFNGDFDLSLRGDLTLDAGRIARTEDGGSPASVTISANRLNLQNSGGIVQSTSLADTGKLVLSAAEIVLGSGDTRLDGFGRTELDSLGDMTFRGRGSFLSEGDVLLSAARFTGTYHREKSSLFTALDYRVDAGGSLSLNSSGGSAGIDSAAGGRLEILARSMTISGTLDVPSAQVSLTAWGTGETDGILMASGARILGLGSADGQGSIVSLKALGGGGVQLDGGALIDVTAGAQGDAGSISISSRGRESVLLGELRGAGRGGDGGSFELDTVSISDLSRLSRVLLSGGFDRSLHLRARSGDVSLGNGDLLKAGLLRLTADAGRVEVFGTLDASRSGGGGSIEINAGGDMVLQSGASLRSLGMGAGSAGGNILLHSASGFLRLLEGSNVNLAGGVNGCGGLLQLTASRDGGDVRMELLGTLANLSGVLAEANRVYAYSGNKSLSALDYSVWRSDAEAFMAGADIIENRLMAGLDRVGWTGDRLDVIAGIEVRGTGDLTLSAPLELTDWRFGGRAGSLALRAGGNLNINADLVDRPTALNSLFSNTASTSWSLNLAAGADFSSSYRLAFVEGVGDFKIADGRMVYTESGPVRFASGRDTLIGPGSPTGYMVRPAIRYSLGSYSGNVQGEVSRDLNIRGGAIQTAVGDIDLRVGRDLNLQRERDFNSGASFTSIGSIRTTGESTTGASGLSRFWEYDNGGDIRLDVRGAVQGGLADDAWDFAYTTSIPRKWAASYENYNTTEGLATLGGGSLFVRTGGDFFSQIGTFGKGDLSLFAGRNLRGRFLVKDGTGEIIAGGNIGSPRETQGLEIFDARVAMKAQGDIHFSTVVNPTIARPPFSGQWNFQYGLDSSVELVARTGSVNLSGDYRFYNLGASISRLMRILPPAFEVEAGGDINIANEFALAPSPTGNLRLAAGGNIEGQYFTSSLGVTVARKGLISMSDMDPAGIAGYRLRSPVNDLFNKYLHAEGPLHRDDDKAVEVLAGGSVQNLDLILSKRATVSVGQDIRDLYLFGQNNALGEITRVVAGGSVIFTSSQSSNFNTGIEWAGPGALVLQANDRLDLGNSRGLQSVGNVYNGSLSPQGSSIFVITGFGGGFEPAGIDSFFDALRQSGKEYSGLLDQGRVAEARGLVERVRRDLMAPFLGERLPGVSGNVEMVSSQISTASADEGIFILCAGDLNVGRSTFFTNEAERKNTGIFTSAGGPINIFALGDINVNESRVMTFRGGDITVWSDRGNVNAGRGSKAAVNASPPRLVPVTQGVFVLIFDPPAVGSGIRALTYDPDGAEGPLREPEPGDIYLFAPEGVIDAGEAGIAGGNIFLGATQIVNAANIVSSAGQISGNAGDAAAGSLGALTGATNTTQEMRADSAAGLSGKDRDALQAAAQSSQDFSAKWLDVKVLSFDVEEKDPEAEEDESRT